MREAILVRGTGPNLAAEDLGGFESRNPATLAFLQETLTRHGADLAGRDYNFLIYTGDNPEACAKLATQIPFVLAYSTASGAPQSPPNVIALPDFIYSGWPETGIESYENSTGAIARAGQKPPVTDKLFWIGNVETHPVRRTLIEIGQRHPDDMHFVAIDWAKANAPGGRDPAAGHFFRASCGLRLSARHSRARLFRAAQAAHACQPAGVCR